MEAQRGWYVIHTYSGYENKVKANLENKIQTQRLTDKIFAVEVPMIEEDDVDSNGKKRRVSRKFFPGYVVVDMIVDEKTWYAVRNTPGVTGFVGSDSTKPYPLTEEEVDRILHRSPAKADAQQAAEEPVRVVIDLEIGQAVNINSGAFESFPARVVDIDYERGKIKVLVEMFGGRETSVELDFNQVEKID